jgi:hypothetical protein
MENESRSGSTSIITTRGAIVKGLIDLINGGHAHVSFDNAVTDIAPRYRGVRPEGLPYSIWQLMEHIRITLWDILEFCKSQNHKSPPWPEGYWPSGTSPTEEAWKRTLAAIKSNRKEFVSLLQSPSTDLFTPFKHGTGQNMIREALLIADHTSYHTGQIIIVRRILGIW